MGCGQVAPRRRQVLLPAQLVSPYGVDANCRRQEPRSPTTLALDDIPAFLLAPCQILCSGEVNQRFVISECEYVICESVNSECEYQNVLLICWVVVCTQSSREISFFFVKDAPIDNAIVKV